MPAAGGVLQPRRTHVETSATLYRIVIGRSAVVSGLRVWQLQHPGFRPQPQKNGMEIAGTLVRDPADGEHFLPLIQRHA